MPVMITLQKIKDRHPCSSWWKKLLKAKGGTTADYAAEFPLSDVLDINGLDDTLWCLRCLPKHNNLWRLYAVWCARQVQHLMTDKRSIDALDVAERRARGLATEAELDAAWDAARAAARVAEWAAEAAKAAVAAWAAGAAAGAAGAAVAAKAAKAAVAAAGAAGAAAGAAEHKLCADDCRQMLPELRIEI